MQHCIQSKFPGCFARKCARTAVLWALTLAAGVSFQSYAAITGYYYDQNNVPNQFFSGTELIRQDGNINFAWTGSGSPDPSIDRDHFSIRWIGELEVPTSGDYTFTTRSDDGARLWIDGVQLVDGWVIQGYTAYSGTLTGLVAGERYSIVMEYFEATGNARVNLSWDGPGFSEQIIPASYLFVDSTPPAVVSAASICLSGELVVNFSEQVTAASAENLANYSADTGVVITNATLGPGGTYVTLDYFAGSGVFFNLSVANISDVNGNSMAAAETIAVNAEANGLVGTYYDQNNTARNYFTGSSVQRIDPVVDFNWGGANPIPGVGGDYFSVRWEGELEAPSDGTYVFYTVSDDGVRLDLNGSRIIDNWTDHSSTTNASGNITLTAGERYPITMEFYENLVEAEARLQWQGPGFSRQTIPTNNLFISCAATVALPVGQWHLEESGWNGSAGEVLDTSGNGLHGRAVSVGGFPSAATSTPAIIGNPGTCGYGQFDGTADGYVQIDDPGASLLDMPTELSMTAWIYPTALPTGGNLFTFISKDENYEIHLNSAGQVYWWWGGGDRQLTSSSSVTLNAWNHIAFTFAAGEQVIYINGQTVATRTSTAALTTNNDPLFFGVDLGFNNRRFFGYIDEVNLFDQALSSFEVVTVRDQTHPCPIPSIDHYAINHSGSGITCEAESVTIIAHDTAHVPVDAAGRTIDIAATSLTPGWLASDASWSVLAGTGVFSSGAGSAQYTFDSGESSVTLALANTSVADIDIDVTDTANVAIGDIDGDPLEDALLSFADTSLRFYNDADGDGNADGTDPISSPNISGLVSTPFVLKAIQTDTNTGACQARLLGTQTVNLAYECLDPNTCANNQDMHISGVAIEENNAGAVSDFSARSLAFDAEGEVALDLNYFDVGQVRLHAQVTLPASGGEPAITLTGASGPTTVRPADLVISLVESLSGGANPGSGASGAGFITSGSSFRVVVESRNALGNITPGFGEESVAEGLVLNPVALVMPAGGVFPGLSLASNFSATGTPGQFANVAVSWQEAGTITLNASIADGDYLGTGDLAGTVSANVGRFYPAHLRLVSHNVNPGCAIGGFTAMSDQLFNYRPLGINYTLQAETASGAVVQNYDSVLGYPVADLVGVAENGDDGIDLASRALVPSGPWEDGIMSIIGTANGGFSRALSAANEVPDGPFSDLQLGIRVQGGNPDGVDLLAANLTMNATSAGSCSAASDCNAAAIGGTQVLQFMRLYGNNTHGPETSPLRVDLGTQFWNGSEFVDANSDSCSQLAMTAIQFNSNPLSTDANRSVSVGAGTSTGSFSSFTAGVDMTMVSGDAGLQFSAPGAGNSGSIDVDIDLTNYPWLRFDWNQNGDNADDISLPGLEVRFGRYRGHDRIIYWEEVLN